jgi:thiol-disulfide isomerase/thioredoxin
MDNNENDKDPDQELEEFGGRKKHKNPKKHIVVGNVYANWCGHCKTLKPEWNKMKRHINHKKGNKNIVYVRIESNDVDTELKKIEEEHKVKIKVGGYPTLFRIKNGKVDYYSGVRQAKQMAEWYLHGGDSNIDMDNLLMPGFKMPGLMQDLQGGRRYFTRNRYRRHNHRRSIHHNCTNSRHVCGNTRRRKTQKKTPGVFDFLFGK